MAWSISSLNSQKNLNTIFLYKVSVAIMLLLLITILHQQMFAV